MYAFITNLAYYNEGKIVGGWFQLGASEEELSRFLSEVVRVDDTHEEYFISDTESETLSYEVNPYCDLYKLNQLINEFYGLEEEEQDTINALLEFGIVQSLEEALNVVSHYCLTYGIESEEDIGYYYLEETGAYEVPDCLRPYLDYEAFGRDFLMNGEAYLTSYGLLTAA